MNHPARIFLDWKRPALEAAAERLLKLNHQQPKLFRRAWLVLPTKESARSLREYLAEQAEGQALLMPRFLLAGQLMPQLEAAGDMEQSAALLHLLQSVKAWEEWPTLFPVPPTESAAKNWCREMSQNLLRTRHKLETYLCSPAKLKESLREHFAELLGESLELELAKWKDMEDIFRRCDAQLRDWGLQSPLDASRRCLEEAAWPASTRLLIFVCVPQISPLTRHYLSRLQGKDGGAVEMWIHAPQQLADSFDAFGQPNERWLQQEIPLEGKQIHVCAHADALAAKAVRLAQGRESRDCVLGIADEDCLPALMQHFGRSGWPVYNAAGRSAQGTELMQLPAQLREAGSGQKAEPLLALLRNSALQNLFGLNRFQSFDLLLDSIQAENFPENSQAFFNYYEKAFHAAEEKGHPVAAAWAAGLRYARDVQKLVKQLDTPAGLPAAFRDLAARAEGLQERRGCAEKLHYSALCRQLAEALRRTADFVEGKAELCRSAEAFFLLEGQLNAKLPPSEERSRCAVDALGWMELIFSPGWELLLCGLHDGAVPENSDMDPLLPDSLCQLLGLDCCRRREIRDCFLLSSLLQSHQGHCELLLARVRDNGDPIRPSRLLCHCPKEQLCERVQQLFAETPPQESAPAFSYGQWHFGTGGNAEPQDGYESIALIAPLEKNRWAQEGRSFSPSRISNFLRCPLRFWMAELLGLDPNQRYEENAAEIAVAAQGSLMHAVLEKFCNEFPTKESLAAAATSPQERMDTLLEEAFAKQVGEKPSFPLLLQKRRLGDTLQAFVEKHLQDLYEGWCVQETELTAEWTLGEDIPLHMVIDRIDHNRISGKWRIVDYKSHNKDPESKHLFQPNITPENFHKLMPGFRLYEEEDGKLSFWKNVQLPLYLEYLQRVYLPMKGEGDIDFARLSCAYYNLPAEPTQVGCQALPLCSAKQENAIACAKQACSLIRRGLCLIPLEAWREAAGYEEYPDLAPDGDLRRSLRLPSLNSLLQA